MKGLRFSLATLLAAFVLIAAGLAVLVNATPLWASITYTLAVLSLLLAVCAAIYRRGTARAFWLGASIFGWCYLLFAVTPPVEWALWWASIGPQKLATDDLLTYLHRKVSRLDLPATNGGTVVWSRSDGTVWIDGKDFAAAEASQAIQDHVAKPATKKVLVYFDSGIGGLGDPGVDLSAIESANVDAQYHQGPVPTIPAEQDFLRVGHTLFALLFALLGGVVCRVLCTTQERKP